MCFISVCRLKIDDISHYQLHKNGFISKNYTFFYYYEVAPSALLVRRHTDYSFAIHIVNTSISFQFNLLCTTSSIHSNNLIWKLWNLLYLVVNTKNCYRALRALLDYESISWKPFVKYIGIYAKNWKLNPMSLAKSGTVLLPFYYISYKLC